MTEWRSVTVACAACDREQVIRYRVGDTRKVQCRGCGKFGLQPPAEAPVILTTSDATTITTTTAPQTRWELTQADVLVLRVNGIKPD